MHCIIVLHLKGGIYGIWKPRAKPKMYEINTEYKYEVYEWFISSLNVLI